MADQIKLETPDLRSSGTVQNQIPVADTASTRAEEFLAPLAQAAVRIFDRNRTAGAADRRAQAAADAKDQEAASMINVIDSMSDVYAGVRERAIGGEFTNPGTMTIEVNEAWSRALVAESKRNPGFLTSDAIVKAWNIHSGVTDDITKQSSITIDGMIFHQDAFGNTELATNLDTEAQLEETQLAVVNFGQEFQPQMADNYLSNLIVAEQDLDPVRRNIAQNEADSQFANLATLYNTFRQAEYEAQVATHQLTMFNLEEAQDDAEARKLMGQWADSMTQKLSSTTGLFFDSIMPDMRKANPKMTGAQAAAAFRGAVEPLTTNPTFVRMVRQFPEYGKAMQDITNANADLITASDFKTLTEWEFGIQNTEQKLSMLMVMNRLAPSQQFQLRNSGALQSMATAEYITSKLIPAIARDNPDVMARTSAFAAAMGEGGKQLGDWRNRWGTTPIDPKSDQWQAFVGDSTNLLVDMWESLDNWRKNLPNEAKYTPDYVLMLWNTMTQNPNFSKNIEEMSDVSSDMNTIFRGITSGLNFYSNSKEVGEAVQAGAQRHTDLFEAQILPLQRLEEQQADAEGE